MLELIAVLNDPLKILPYPQERSGLLIEDDYADSIYFFTYPSSPNPVLCTEYEICDNSGNCLPVGFYEVALSSDRVFLLLVERGNLMARVPVVELDIKPKNEFEEQRNQKRKEKKARWTNEKNQDEWKQQARMHARIQDSGEGYYVLEYRNDRVRAKGYIPY